MSLPAELGHGAKQNMRSLLERESAIGRQTPDGGRRGRPGGNGDAFRQRVVNRAESARRGERRAQSSRLFAIVGDDAARVFHHEPNRLQMIRTSEIPGEIRSLHGRDVRNSQRKSRLLRDEPVGGHQKRNQDMPAPGLRRDPRLQFGNQQQIIETQTFREPAARHAFRVGRVRAQRLQQERLVPAQMDDFQRTMRRDRSHTVRRLPPGIDNHPMIPCTIESAGNAQHGLLKSPAHRKDARRQKMQSTHPLSRSHRSG